MPLKSGSFGNIRFETCALPSGGIAWKAWHAKSGSSQAAKERLAQTHEEVELILKAAESGTLQVSANPIDMRQYELDSTDYDITRLLGWASGTNMICNLKWSMREGHPKIKQNNRIKYIDKLIKIAQTMNQNELVQALELAKAERQDTVKTKLDEPTYVWLKAILKHPILIPNEPENTQPLRLFAQSATAHSGADPAPRQALEILGFHASEKANWTLVSTVAAKTGLTNVSEIHPQNQPMYFCFEAKRGLETKREFSQWTLMTLQMALQLYDIGCNKPNEWRSEMQDISTKDQDECQKSIQRNLSKFEELDVKSIYDYMYCHGCINKCSAAAGLNRSTHEQWLMTYVLASMIHTALQLKPGGSATFKMRKFKDPSTMMLMALMATLFDHVEYKTVVEQTSTFVLPIMKGMTEHGDLRKKVARALVACADQRIVSCLNAHLTVSHISEETRERLTQRLDVAQQARSEMIQSNVMCKSAFNSMFKAWLNASSYGRNNTNLMLHSKAPGAVETLESYLKLINEEEESVYWIRRWNHLNLTENASRYLQYLVQSSDLLDMMTYDDKINSTSNEENLTSDEENLTSDEEDFSSDDEDFSSDDEWKPEWQPDNIARQYRPILKNL